MRITTGEIRPACAAVGHHQSIVNERRVIHDIVDHGTLPRHGRGRTRRGRARCGRTRVYSIRLAASIVEGDDLRKCKVAGQKGGYKPVQRINANLGSTYLKARFANGWWAASALIERCTPTTMMRRL